MPELKESIQNKYGAAARRVMGREVPAECCPPDSCCGGKTALGRDPITSDLYEVSQVHGVPDKAMAASLGCGNPTALADLRAGEVVLDLGSGGGIDVLLSAQRVSPTGKAYGLDMTDDMLALARQNQQEAGVTNAEFLKGDIEHIPLPANSVDVVISNCVINLAGNKDRVLAEACRVLKPGGRFAVSDVVVRGNVPVEVRKNVELWIGCIAGALEGQEYSSKLAHAGFEQISIQPIRVYQATDARNFLAGRGLDADAIVPQIEGKFMSAFVRATKPAERCA